MTSQQRKRKILLVPDIPGWAFDHHAKDMMEMPSNKVQLDLKYSNQVTIEDSENYDLIYAMAVIMAIDFYKLGIPLDKMIGGISSMRQFRFCALSILLLENLLSTLNRIEKFIKQE